MAVPTSISDCNATAANNSPAGSDSIGTSLDDYLRAHAAIIRQVYDALVVVDGTLLPKAGGTVTGTVTTAAQIKGITPVAAEDLTRKDYVDSLAGTVSGTYTPTLSNGSNMATYAVDAPWHYSRIGSMVIVSGSITGSVTSLNTLSTLRCTMPVTSNFTAASDANGTIGSGGDPAIMAGAGYVYAQTAPDALDLRFRSGTNYTVTFSFIAQYIVK